MAGEMFPVAEMQRDIITGGAAADRETVATQVATPVNFLLISTAEAPRHKINQCTLPFRQEMS